MPSLLPLPTPPLPLPSPPPLPPPPPPFLFPLPFPLPPAPLPLPAIVRLVRALLLDAAADRGDRTIGTDAATGDVANCRDGGGM